MKLIHICGCIFVFNIYIAFGLEDCPSPDEIAPCICEPQIFLPSNLHITCSGPLVTQQVIEDVFKVLHKLEDPLIIGRFLLEGTTMNTLDLAPITNTGFHGGIQIMDNPNLTAITWPPLDSFKGTIGAYSFKLRNCEMLTDSGFGDTLKYLNATTLWFLSIQNNPQLSGSKKDGEELFPGLSAFTEASYFSLNGNNISKLVGSQFQFNYELTTLELAGNSITEIGEDAFLIERKPDRPINNDSWTILVIDLYQNQLTNQGIHPNLGLEKLDIPVSFSLSGNLGMNTISQTTFEKYLQIPGNRLFLYGCPIVCDERVKWLKDNQGIYKDRVIFADCINDPGHTVFTSNKIV